MNNNTRFDQWLRDGVTLRDSLILDRNNAMTVVNNLNKEIAELDRFLTRTVPEPITESPTAKKQGKQPKTEKLICCVLAEHGEMKATALAREVATRFGTKEGYVRSVLSVMRQRGHVKARLIDENSAYKGFYYSLPST